MQQHTEVLLIGGGVASVRCARTLRREGFEGRITLVGAEETPPYNRPPLSKELLRDDLPDDLALAEPERWYERRNVDLRTGARVTSLDLEHGNAVLDDGSTIGFDRCLVATGAEPIVPPIPGVEHALTLRTLPDARRLRAAALAADDGRVTIVGGGFIGVEVASSLASLGLRPTILERGGSLWDGALGPELARWAATRLTDAGVDLRLGTSVTGIGPDGVEVGVERVTASATLLAVGVRPRDGLVAAAGLDVDDGIVTDVDHRTSHPAVWAAGDMARVAGRRVEHWHTAREGGERAARSMLGLPVPAARAPWFFSEVTGTSLDVFGAATAWDNERWLRPASVLAYLDGEQVVQLAVIGGAIEAEVARKLVEERASVIDVEASIGPLDR